MGRDLRIIEPSGIYHVISRGNNRGRLFWDELDHEVFLRRLDRVAQKYEWIGLAYCLMTTHYHLVVQLPEDGLSVGMQELNGEYARRTNYRHHRVGHLFQNRFYSDLITSERHLFGAIRYVALNPVKAGMCPAPENWPWSSYRASAGLEFPSITSRFRSCCGCSIRGQPMHMPATAASSIPDVASCQTRNVRRGATRRRRVPSPLRSSARCSAAGAAPAPRRRGAA
jgi:REP element-mobilizing transposase RayT